MLTICCNSTERFWILCNPIHHDGSITRDLTGKIVGRFPGATVTDRDLAQYFVAEMQKRLAHTWNDARSFVGGRRRDLLGSSAGQSGEGDEGGGKLHGESIKQRKVTNFCN